MDILKLNKQLNYKNTSVTNPSAAIDFNSRVNNYLNALLWKHWSNLLNRINFKKNLGLPYKPLLKVNRPTIAIEQIKSSYSINYDKLFNNADKTTSKDILIETPLNKCNYYFEVNLSFNNKNKLIYSDMMNIESTTKHFLKKNIGDKFEYKLFFQYQNI